VNKSRNFAARAAHWSAEHRKTAIFGWIAFVIVAFMLGKAVGQNQIHGADAFSGEAGRAERTLEDAGLRPNTEHLLIQSKELKVDAPEFTATIEQATARLSRAEDVRNVVSPLAGDAPVSVDQHSALVDFEITGNSLEARDRLEPAQAAVSAVQEEHPQLRVEQFGSVSSNKELNETFASDLAKAEGLSFPLTLIILWSRHWAWSRSRATSPRSTPTSSPSSSLSGWRSASTTRSSTCGASARSAPRGAASAPRSRSPPPPRGAPC
jgi:uncharacterized membrane protein YdfJ with MMPL/SSD domain